MDIIQEARLLVADRYIIEYSKTIDNFNLDNLKCEIDTLIFVEKYLYFYEDIKIFEIHITNRKNQKELLIYLKF